MSYEDAYNEAHEKGDTLALTKQIVTWEDEGQRIVGKVLSIDPFTDGIFEGEVKVYTLETDAGLVTTVLGAATDKQLEKKDPLGLTVAITFKGKKPLSKGGQCNIFEIEAFQGAEKHKRMGKEKTEGSAGKS